MTNNSMKHKQTSQVTMSPQRSMQHNRSAGSSYFTHECSVREWFPMSE